MGERSVWLYFTDAVLRAPTLGSMLMCCAASLVGVIVFLRKQSLLGESLSHAAYPGVILGIALVSLIDVVNITETTIVVGVMTGAFCTSLLGLWFISLLETRLKVASDAALCFILSAFFGIGLTIASRLQFTETALYRQGQAYLFGQVATMTDWHVMVYALLTLVTIFVIATLYKEIQVLIFDPELAVTLGLPVGIINSLLFILIVFAVVIGLRSVGVVLMSAMLIAPAAAARQLTNRLSWMLLFSALIGMASGFLGNYLSVELSHVALTFYSFERFAIPTGPMIVLVATAICIMALLFAPQRGFIPRLIRIAGFRFQCLTENLLKSLWRFGPSTEVSFEQLAQYQSSSSLYLKLVITWLIFQGWIDRTPQGLYGLTNDGRQRAGKIVRLHRLWEVYLAHYLGVGGERVHRNAEEMEHIITPELEEELIRLLNNPKKDPHQQPIPQKNKF